MCATSYAVDDEPIEHFVPGAGKPAPDAFIECARNPAWSIAAHNDSFESAIAEYALAPRFGWPLVPIERHACSMALARYHGFAGALEKVANALKLPVRKDKAGRRLMLRLCKPHGGAFIEPTAAELAQLAAYCANDVAVERAVMHALPALPESEALLWQLDREINDRGFTVDVALAVAARDLVAAAKAQINARIGTRPTIIDPDVETFGPTESL
jgi:DNA polymerase